MEKLQINCPEGYEIDKDKSNLSEGVVYFKEINKQLTYDAIAYKLFGKGDLYSIDNHAGILRFTGCRIDKYDLNNACSREQLESLLALNKLINVANYLNDGWIPNKTRNDNKWFIGIQFENLKGFEYSISIKSHNTVMYSIVYFKTRELAKQAIEILGGEEIEKALTLNHLSTI